MPNKTIKQQPQYECVDVLDPVTGCLVSTIRPVSKRSRTPVLIPETCGSCGYFEQWNDGSCTVPGSEANAELGDSPPANCPKRLCR